jgi:hypothetical protein
MKPAITIVVSVSIVVSIVVDVYIPASDFHDPYMIMIMIIDQSIDPSQAQVQVPSIVYRIVM